ncbi:putative AAA family ATPase GCN20 [Rhizophagus irregularis DAOM 197198w]|uniref:Putative AAA family ATPase GCN20 n=1 Tax=Rhizophagus irregularis (strain DAOM 197198w) TaxID=1432141 RepID=A0A015KHZ8_RHIIW|nr:putative AAA family ATPase GCN20 [Rhizophagus irregularis DAOM 197198w]
MVGDDVEAIQAVLSADVWREHLLNEERSLNAQINELETSPDPNMDDTNLEQMKESLNKSFVIN